MLKISQVPRSMGITLNVQPTKHHIDIEDRQFQRMQMVGNLMCGLTHDFNNILTIILSCTELAQLSGRSHSQLHLESVTNAATRGQHLIQQILLFGRQQEQKPKPINLAEVIQSTLSLLRVSLSKTIEIDSDRANHPSFVLADFIQISQMLMNLCLNAAQSMGSTGGVLELSLIDVMIDQEMINDSPALHAGSFVRMRVRDTGSGIPPEVIEQMFDPFFTTKESGGGMGMGLTVVQDVVARHDGMMVVDSIVEQGTRFDIYLPHISDRVEADAIRSRPIYEENECPVVDTEFVSRKHFHENMQPVDCCALTQLRS